MHIQFNDEPIQCVENLTLAKLLEQLRFLQPGVALAINQTIIPREQWETYLLNDGDQILLFQAIAGG
ncbi:MULTISPECIES: sulfur carrier protein ThiS [Buttiauxella]|jgi:sulfur carrier protein|uniref:Sulfur carrier protein n=1 Tax=Buttiauxella ferragutiae ATCC 51602 TaxID=1354252 RepID=A0ABX2WCX8_9ENTR|nr:MULTISPECIES: sulfur carrier protein ThiS [Buttiauxella]AYN28042.1 sulfur carrier protein ThiS [Buttiauxella sp. 3AFRM03]MCE0828869.1 sulfur carrier protein ThiS [Buttiauxella ferragutiae]OAT31482.1 sulfur carrier protein [Buttiauxella ferragutiae ATCC 51602]TDN47313.1 sulfur carrier protein ThiS [Buttiauxella sp. JUb87]